MNDHAAANGAFRDAYREAHERAGRGRPVLVVLGDDLVLCLGSERVRRSFVTERFVRIKSIAHVPLAAFLVVDDAHDVDARRALRERIRHLEVPDESLVPLLDETATLLDRAIAGARVDLDAFAARMGDALLRATDLATSEQLRELHLRAGELLGMLGAEAQREVVVVVTGSHQARDRRLEMQYFRKRFDETSSHEKRVIYGEAIESADDAVALAGKTLLDRRLASAFFADPGRLQRDVLGDSAAAQLRAFDLGSATRT